LRSESQRLSVVIPNVPLLLHTELRNSRKSEGTGGKRSNMNGKEKGREALREEMERTN